MRDFIPEGEDLDGDERAHADNIRKLYRNGVYQDFIPAEDHAAGDKLSREDHIEQTLARRAERMRTAVEDEFADAKRRLQNLTPTQAVEFIASLPPKRMEMFLLAEEAIGGRRAILGRFPAPSPKARQLFNVPLVASIPTEKRPGTLTDAAGEVVSSEPAPAPKAVRPKAKKSEE